MRCYWMVTFLFQSAAMAISGEPVCKLCGDRITLAQQYAFFLC